LNVLAKIGRHPTASSISLGFAPSRLIKAEASQQCRSHLPISVSSISGRLTAVVRVRRMTASARVAEKERLEIERDISALRSEIASHSVPWWRRAGIVAALTALVSSTAPAVAAINGHYQVQRELELKEAEQKHEMSLRYLDRMKDEAERERTLRFLAATAADPPLRAWANAEQKTVANEVKQLKEKLSDTSRDLNIAVAAVTEAAAAKQADVKALQKKADELAAQKASLEARLRAPVAPPITAPIATPITAPAPEAQASPSGLYLCRGQCDVRFPPPNGMPLVTSPEAQKCEDKCYEVFGVAGPPNTRH
jgi:hypothetical protein